MRSLILFIATAFILVTGYGCGRLYAGKNEKIGPFEYRDVYLPDYNREENSQFHLNTVDEDWGIWGHNLAGVVPEDASNTIYAKVGGGVDDDQFCFSSPKLLEYVSDYIRGQYLLSDTMRFAILPNDNAVVCLCSECVKKGNTKGNAAPAVHDFINKLAKKFPQHIFFTSHYLTTNELPPEKMPANTGVLISAMEYPLSPAETPQEMAFLELLNQWKEKTDRVYVWDYIMNYDDYFTPFPIFNVMQRRLQFYRDAGVTGVFLNGSGNDYSTFARLRKAVLGDMMADPDIDWEQSLRKYALKFYPKSGKDIADFMVLQEKIVKGKGATLPIYDGIGKAIRTYLPEVEFVDFYNRLVQHKKEVSGEEKEELELMTDAMAFTMLELKRYNFDVENTEKLKERLGRLLEKDITTYNEGMWGIDRYLQEYTFMENNARATKGSNLLKGTMLLPRTPLDEDYTDITILTNGLLGTPSNYHNGILISSADPALNIHIPRKEGMKTLKVWLVNNPGFKIFLPEQVYVTVGGVKSKIVEPRKEDAVSGHLPVEFDISGGGDILLTLRKSPDAKTMALDEIEAF